MKIAELLATPPRGHWQEVLRQCERQTILLNGIKVFPQSRFDELLVPYNQLLSVDLFSARRDPLLEGSPRLADEQAISLWNKGVQPVLLFAKKHLPCSTRELQNYISSTCSKLLELHELTSGCEGRWADMLGTLWMYQSLTIHEDTERQRCIRNAMLHYRNAVDKMPDQGGLYLKLSYDPTLSPLRQMLLLSQASLAQNFCYSWEDLDFQGFHGKLSAGSCQTEATFLKAHLAISSASSWQADVRQGFIDILNDDEIANQTPRYSELCFMMAIVNCASLLGFGAMDNPLRKAICEANPSRIRIQQEDFNFKYSRAFFTKVFWNVLTWDDNHLRLSYVHVVVAFLHQIARYPSGMVISNMIFAPDALVDELNQLNKLYQLDHLQGLDKLPSGLCLREFLSSSKDDDRTLPEDSFLRGMFFAPPEDSEEYLKRPLLIEPREVCLARVRRILRHALAIAELGESWLKYSKNVFSLQSNYEESTKCCQVRKIFGCHLEHNEDQLEI